MVELVYLLCALTSTGCALLLFRGYLRARSRLLLWSSLCFIGLSLNNILLFVDMLVVHNVSLEIPRGIVGLGALLVLIFGLVWEAA